MNTIHASTHDKVKRMATIAMLAAVVIVLQALSSFIKFGPFSLTLALTPVIIGAAIYGWKAGAFLGFVFSAYVFCSGLWIDGSMVAMIQYSFLGTTVICFLKGTAAGAAAGFVYKLLEKKSPFAATMAASIVTPVVNTGIFALGMMTIMNGFLTDLAVASGSANPMSFLFLIMIGVNFIAEFVVNVALGTVLTRIIDYFNKRIKK
ncbi:MAG: ECF transporter S component [Clostridia bacterium]|nr:ECF transporter S component [Clostridia bacterium]